MSEGFGGGERALVRAVSPAMHRCELTHLARSPIDPVRAASQHARYVSALVAAGLTVTELDGPSAFPDAVFIEDTAVLVPELAVLARPGAASRRGEVAAVADAIGAAPVARITAPATLDGGDVLVLGRHVYVGRSSRTNAAGVAQLAEALAPFDYRVSDVPVVGCLHLKSAVTALGQGLLVCNPAWVDATMFVGHEVIAVHPEEPCAANVLAIGRHVVCASAAPRTIERWAGRDLRPLPVDVSELAKAEGGVTCCSLVFP